MPPTPPRRVSLRDVAQELGVSHVTVSLALRGDLRISARRRQQVEEAAKRLGYTPDPMLSSLSAYRQAKRPVVIRSTVAWLNQWEPPKALRTFHEFDNYWLGAKAAAERLGYHLEEFVVGPELSPARLQQILVTRNVRGILIPPHQGPFSLPGFDWSLFSVVRFGASVKLPRAHIVTSDQVKCAALAFARAHEHGYRKIGYVSSVPFERNTKGNFRAGYLSSQENFVPMRRHLHPVCLPEERNTAANRAELRRWLRSVKPDAIITSMVPMRTMLDTLGVKVPGDVAVAALSIADGRFDCGVDQNSEEIGRVAMGTLAGLIHQCERGVPDFCRRVLVEGRWIEGTSMPRKAAPAAPAQVSGAR